MLHDDYIVSKEPALAGVERNLVVTRYRDCGRGGGVGIPFRGDAVIRLKASRSDLGRRRQRPRAGACVGIHDRCTAIRRIGGGDCIGVNRVSDAVVFRRHVAAGKIVGWREGILAVAIGDEEADSTRDNCSILQSKDERRVKRTGLGRSASKEESVRALLEADTGREAGRRRRLHQLAGNHQEVRTNIGLHRLVEGELLGLPGDLHFFLRQNRERAVGDNFKGNVIEAAVLVGELVGGKSVAVDSRGALGQVGDSGKLNVRYGIDAKAVLDFQVEAGKRLFGAVVAEGCRRASDFDRDLRRI